MAAIITKDMRLHNARQFVEAVSEVANTTLYMFVGKPDSWASESAPDTPLDTYRAQIDIWDNIIALKKVTSADIIHAIPRRNWTSGTRYVAYSDAISASNLFSSQFVVLNSAYNVYKCLGNANTTSTVEPTGTGQTANNIVNTSDGYIWKYMYTADTANILKFGTTSFFPVMSNASVTTNSANAKGIYSYRIINANINNGSVTDNTVLNIIGDGTSANANIRVTSGNITLVNVINPGNNYSYANITTSIGSAVIEPIIAPPDGHGYDVIDELGAIYALVNIRLEQTDTDIPNNTKFRQIGLIKDPFNYGTSTISTASTLKNYGNLTISTPTNTSLLLPGTVFKTSGGSNAIVVSYSGDAVSGVLNYVQNRYAAANIVTNFRTIINGETITVGVNSIGTISGNSVATVAQNSGEIMYIDNRNVIARASDQVESLYVILEF
jgi:hypothetical protein